MARVSNLGQTRATKEWLRRMEEAGWQGHAYERSAEGTVGGPTIYLCHVERRVHIAVHLLKEGFERSAEFAREQGLSFEDACDYLGSALEDAAKIWPGYSPEVHSALILFASLYLPGTKTYRAAQQFGAASQYLIMRYKDVSTGEYLLRPAQIPHSRLLSPVELEGLVETNLAMDRTLHPERFPRGEVLPFRLRSRGPEPSTSDAPSAASAAETARSEALADPRLPAPVRERLMIVAETARAKLRAIEEKLGEDAFAQIEARVNAVVDSRESPWIRLRALYAIVDEMLSHVQGHIACRRRCAHCCHIRVELAKPEAAMLGMAIRKTPKPALGRQSGEFEAGYHNPCTFLNNGECSIYSHRPLACRTHVNLDQDALLCELNGPTTAALGAIPGLTLQGLFAWAYRQICGTARVADIREYFPPRLNSKKDSS